MKYLEDLTVGDFEGLSVEAIANILQHVPRRNPSPAVCFKIAEEAAKQIMNFKYED